MLYIKVILAVSVVLSGVELSRLKDFFKPLLIVYLLISSISFYLLFKEVFIVYYSGTELMMSEDGQEYSVRLVKNWVFLLLALGFIYSLPGLLFFPSLRSLPYVVLILIFVSILPDFKPGYIWDKITVKENC